MRSSGCGDAKEGGRSGSGNRAAPSARRPILGPSILAREPIAPRARAFHVPSSRHYGRSTVGSDKVRQRRLRGEAGKGGRPARPEDGVRNAKRSYPPGRRGVPRCVTPLWGAGLNSRLPLLHSTLSLSLSFLPITHFENKDDRDEPAEPLDWQDVEPASESSGERVEVSAPVFGEEVPRR